MKNLTLIAIILFSTNVYAQRVGFFWGSGARDNAGQLFFGSFNHQLLHSNWLYAEYAGGGFVLRDAFDGNPTGFGALSLGVRVSNRFVFAKFSNGCAVITETNKYLDTHIQILTAASFGISDFVGGQLGFGFKHLSNGMARSTNGGMDWMGIDFSFNI